MDYDPDDLEAELEVDMTPMIDVTFLLLIFFMVTMTLAQPTEVKLPRSTSGKAETIDGKLIIHLYEGDDRQKLFRVGTDESATLKLSELKAVVARNVDVKVAMIRADEDLPFTYVNEVASSLKKSGLKQVKLGVKESEFVK